MYQVLDTRYLVSSINTYFIVTLCHSSISLNTQISKLVTQQFSNPSLYKQFTFCLRIGNSPISYTQMTRQLGPGAFTVWPGYFSHFGFDRGGVYSDFCSRFR